MATNEKNGTKQKSATKSTATASTSTTSNQPLFQQIQTKDGRTRIICDTNDTLEMVQPIPAPVVQEKLDDVLAAVRQLDTTCCHKKCKTKTGLMFMDCILCKRRFCFKHGLPEVHGCGDAVKRQERDAFQHPIPQKTKQKEKDLENAKDKLHQKLKDMNISRKSKPISGKTKK